MNKPESKISKDWQEYVDHLEGRLTDYETDGFIGLYYSLNSQLNTLAKEIREADIKFSGDDKMFERFMKTNENLKKMLENIDFLRLKLGLNKEDDDKKILNPIEEFSKRKRNEG